MRDKIHVMVKSGSIKRSIENFGGGRFLIKTSETSVDKVNEDALFMLSKTLSLPIDRVVLVAGENSDNKIFQIV